MKPSNLEQIESHKTTFRLLADFANRQHRSTIEKIKTPASEVARIREIQAERAKLRKLKPRFGSRASHQDNTLSYEYHNLVSATLDRTIAAVVKAKRDSEMSASIEALDGLLNWLLEVRPGCRFSPKEINAILALIG